MRVEFQMNGVVAGTYFPGLSRPVVIQSDELGENDAHELQRLLDASRFFDQPSTTTVPARPADRRQYIITVEDHERCHTVYLTEPITDAELQSLITFLNQQVKVRRAAMRQQHGRQQNDPA